MDILWIFNCQVCAVAISLFAWVGAAISLPRHCKTLIFLLGALSHHLLLVYFNADHVGLLYVYVVLLCSSYDS